MTITPMTTLVQDCRRTVADLDVVVATLREDLKRQGSISHMTYIVGELAVKEALLAQARSHLQRLLGALDAAGDWQLTRITAELRPNI